MPDWLAILIGIATLTTLIGGIIAAGAKYVLLPWLRDNLMQKIDETHKSLTENGGKNNPPTMLDKVHDLSGKVDQLIVVSGANAQRASDLAERMDDVHDIAEEARDIGREALDDFREHERRGERYLGEVRLVLGSKGIELPPAHD